MASQTKTAAFLFTRGVEQIEFTSPRDALKDAGINTVVISPAGTTVQAMQQDWDHGDTFAVDISPAEAQASDYDLLVLPGGTLNADSLRLDEDAVALVKDFFAAGKPVAAICHAPWILAQADLARGKSLTSYQAVRVDMINAGANWQDAELVVDDNLITSRNPGDLDVFNKALIDALN